jgi:hypothetical protein
MSFRSRILKAEIEALRIALGAQASEKHKDLKILALLGSQKGTAYLLLDKLPELMKLKEPIEFVKELLKITGMGGKIDLYNEVSRLSMIVGDSRKGFKVKPSEA